MVVPAVVAVCGACHVARRTGQDGRERVCVCVCVCHGATRAEGPVLAAFRRGGRLRAYVRACACVCVCEGGCSPAEATTRQIESTLELVESAFVLKYRLLLYPAMLQPRL